MTRMKKLASILLALVMVMSVATASAATVTVTNGTTHTYDAYQVFAGTQGESEGPLGDVTWGTGVNGEALLADLKTAHDTFEDCDSAAAVAAALAGKADNSEEALLLAELALKHKTGVKVAVAAGETTLDSGYYLLVDTTVLTGTEHDAKNLALLQVTNDIVIAKKYEVPSVEKTVNDNDANIGDTVTFTLTATMPSNLMGYDTYKVVFHDTLSDGLAYAGNLKVTIEGEPVDASKYDVDQDGNDLTITFADVLVLGADVNDKIVVTYDAIVDDDAVIGKDGNENKVYLEYSNDPNWDGTGDKEPTGNTPEDEVKVYTWEIPVFKYTGTDTPLAGAGFTLYKGENAVNLVATDDPTIYKVCTQTGCQDHTHVTEIVTGETGRFQIEGLEQGTYVLSETTTPAGYNTCADVTVVIGEKGVINATAEHPEGVTEVGILNQSGATLPETGGMGTTILYVAGGLLIAAALIVLVAKRRTAA